MSHPQVTLGRSKASMIRDIVKARKSLAAALWLLRQTNSPTHTIERNLWTAVVNLSDVHGSIKDERYK